MSANCPSCGHEFEVRVTVDRAAMAEFLEARRDVLDSLERAVERGARKGMTS